MIIFVTQEWSCLGLAMLAKSQGSKVICAYKYSDEAEPDDLTQTDLIGDGLVDKLPLDEATKKLIGSGNLWVFDGNELPKYADRLKRAGESVVGTSSLCAKMEDDRDYAAEVAELVGLDMPETQKFSDYQTAIKFLESNKKKSFAYKPFKGDPTATYVPQEREDLVKANSELREYISGLSATSGKPQFILQEVVEGIEAALDLWVQRGVPKVAFCDLESKRKLTGDLGENIGCAGDYIFVLPFSTKIVQETVAKYLSWKELKDYTGTVDVNVSIVNGKPLFFENCFRFAYNAYPATFHGLARASVEDIIREWVDGRHKDMSSMFKSGFAGSLTLVADHPKEGSPIIVPKGLENSFNTTRAFKDDVGLRMVEGWPEIGSVIAHGPTIESVGQQCLDLAKQVAFPDKGYRIDLTQADLPGLPLRRFRDLQTLGYLR